MSLAVIRDSITVAQDAPWAFDLNIYSDLLATQPVALQNAAAWLRSPGGAQVVASLDNGKALVSGATASYRLMQSDLAQLAAGAVYIEAQWQDVLGNVGRADLTGVKLVAGSSAGFANPLALGVAYNITFAAEEGDAAVLGLVGGPMGPLGPEGPPGTAAAATIGLSASAQSRLAALNLPAANVEAAILALAGAVKALTGETPEQETISSTT